MRKLFQGATFKLCLVIVAALLIGTGAATLLHGKTTPVNTVVSMLTAPLQHAASFLAQQLSGFSVSFRSSNYYRQELADLQAENDALRDQLVEFEKAKQKNEMYQEFYGLKQEHSDYEFVEAAVIGRDAAADIYTALTLNKGSKAGVAVGDPVIYGKNLVGIITQVSPLQCTVKTLLSTNSNVGVYELGTNESGYVTTTRELSAQGYCRMPGLDAATTIAPGGTVCTSGTTGKFPRDLLVGTVIQVLDDTLDISSYALIQPSAPFSALRDVFIITAFEGQEGAAP